MYSLDQTDHLTLRAFDSMRTVISSPWLNRNPLCQWGNGSGDGFPGLPVFADMPGWDWNSSTGVYTFDGTTIKSNPSLTIALSSREAICFLEVSRDNNGFSFNLAAPAATPESTPGK